MSARISAGISSWSPLAILLALIVGLGVLTGLFASAGLRQDVLIALIYLIIVVGLQIFSGSSGVVSLGHVGFVGVGAYVAGILSAPSDRKASLLPDLPAVLQELQLHPMIALIAAAAAGAILALVISWPLLSLSGVSAQIATFGFVWIVYVVLGNWEAVTGGTAGFAAVPLVATLPMVVALSCIVVLSAFVFQRSRLGLRLRAGREDEYAATAVGVNVRATRVPALVLSGAVAALGGGVYGFAFGSLGASNFFLDMTMLTLTMLIVGGVNSLSGAVVGALTVSAVAKFFGTFEDGVALGGFAVEAPTGTRALGLAIFLLLVLYLRPSGITGGKELRWRPRGEAAY